MNDLTLGNKIRELRKKKGITQEAFASALSVSPQAVSKWESGTSYPDMTLIPVLAGYFEVSLDILFEYDVAQLKDQVQKIIADAKPCFFSDPAKYAQIIKNALCDYPDNEALLSALLDSYEYDLRNNGNTEQLENILDISQKIITESRDLVRICSAKEVRAAAYLQTGKYEKAKEVLETLPGDVTLKNDAIAFRLTGKDKLNGAILARCHHLQYLYMACMEEGDAWYRMNSNTKFCDHIPPADFIPNALKAYQQGLTVLCTFIPQEDPVSEDQYLWSGMQTFHWSFHQHIAACYKKLNRLSECQAEIDEAYRIISTAWKDFEENRDYYMKPFHNYMADLDLTEYIR